MTTIIEIATIRPPKEGKKIGTVVDATGRSFEAWPDMAAKLEVGARYDVEIKEREWNSRTFRTITKATPVGTANNVNAPPQNSEEAFVARTLAAFITAGKVNLDARELGEATRLLQRLHSHFFGVGNGTLDVPHMTAAE